MAKATTTITFADGDQVTSAKLNQIISGFSLGSDSVDGSTITLSGGGALSVGTLSAANYGALSVGTAAIAAGAITAAKLGAQAVETANIKLLNITGATIAEDTIGWTKTLTADRAVQADVQSETAAHFVAPSVMKYHPGVSKAGGIVDFVSGSATITGGYNVTSATDTGSGRQITLAVTMANTNYRVQACYVETADVAGGGLGVTVNSTTQFTIYGAEGTGRKIMFDVFGQLA
jgi:hypothetical protein